jgi:hypothetical protein
MGSDVVPPSTRFRPNLRGQSGAIDLSIITDLFGEGTKPQRAPRSLEQSAVESFQWMRNKEGGQAYGNQQVTVPLTEQIFQQEMKPRMQDGYAASLAEYQAKHPEVTHASFVKVAGEGPWKFNGNGTVDSLRPNPPNRGWAMPVDSFKSRAAKAQGKTADSEAFPAPRGQAMPDVDADYMAAVKRGDTETAQRMVDEAATFDATSPKLWLSTEFEQPSLEKVTRAARKLPSASDPVAALIDVYGGGVERYRQGWIVKHQNGSTAFYNDKAGRTQSMNITDSTRIRPDWLVVHRTEGEYLDPTLFQTGRPTLIFSRHFTNKSAERAILSRGKLKKMGSTFYNDNEALGMFAIGYDDPSWAPGLEDYGGQSVTGWVRMENPMVLHSTDITELPPRRVEELMVRMREKGHDGIVYQRDPMPSERAVEFLTPMKAADMPDIQSKVDSAIREAPEFYRDAIAKATKQDRSAWALSGLKAILQREKIPPASKGEAQSVATAARAVRSWVLKTTDAGKRILKAEHDRVAKVAEKSASSPNEGVFRTPWVVIPWDKVNTGWKLADPITRDGSGNIIPPSKRFDRSKPDVRYGIAGAALAAGAMAAQEEQ